MDWRHRISVDPMICHGRACIKDTRVMVSALVDTVADGESIEETAAAYEVAPDDVRAALQYAAEVIRERIVRLPGAA